MSRKKAPDPTGNRIRHQSRRGDGKRESCDNCEIEVIRHLRPPLRMRQRWWWWVWVCLGGGGGLRRLC